MKKVVFIMVLLSAIARLGLAQTQTKTDGLLPVKYEELTAPDFVKAVEKSEGVCIIPLGIMEKHGPHMPLGTDLIAARNLAVNAAKMEYAVVFPEYYFGQINEAKHQPGTIAYSPELTWKLLQETCNELARNGFSKIVLVNGHGGNNDFLHYFVFCQNAEAHPYQLFLYEPQIPDSEMAPAEKLVKSKVEEMHAGERETSEMLAIRPDLVKLDAVKSESGNDQARLNNLPDFFTALWWYARFPNHYAGDAQYANAQLGKMLVDIQVKHLAKALRQVKEDSTLRKLQEQYQKETSNPTKSK